MIDARLDAFVDRCGSCDAVVVAAWGPRKNDKRLIFNADHTERPGRYGLRVHAGELQWLTPTRGQVAGMRLAGQPLYVEHEPYCSRGIEVGNRPKVHPVQAGNGTPRPEYCCERRGNARWCARCPLRTAAMDWQARERALKLIK